MSAPDSVLVVIPARAGSRRLPGKNNLVLAGRPLLAYTLDAVAEARTVTTSVVVTNDPQFKRTAEILGIAVVDEPPELATDTSPVFPAIEFATQEMERRCGHPFEYVVICDPNVPVRPPGIIDQVVAALARHPTADLAVSIEPCGRRHPEWALVLDADETATFPGAAPERTQELPPRYFITAAAHAVRRSSLAGGILRYADARLCGVVHSADAALDFDTANEIPFIEFMLMRQKQQSLKSCGSAPLRTSAESV